MKRQYTRPTLRIERYDGVYLEDGSDREVTGVAAAVLRNAGDRPVEYACVRMEDGALEFVVTGLDAGAIIVVPASGMAAYEDRTWYGCSAQAAYAPSMNLAKDQVAVRETEDGALEVSNLSGTEIPCLRIFYKFYLDDQDLYVGGITYNVKLLGLASGETRTVTPSHYLSGYSRVVMVKTYDEEN